MASESLVHVCALPCAGHASLPPAGRPAVAELRPTLGLASERRGRAVGGRWAGRWARVCPTTWLRVSGRGPGAVRGTPGVCPALQAAAWPPSLHVTRLFLSEFEGDGRDLTARAGGGVRLLLEEVGVAC